MNLIEHVPIQNTQEIVSEPLPAPPNSRPFDLELALRGWPLVNRQGYRAKLIGYAPEVQRCIAFHVHGEVHACDGYGHFDPTGEATCLDLFLATLP